MPDFPILGLEFQNIIVIFEICLVAKFGAKIKVLKSGSKNV